MIIDTNFSNQVDTILTDSPISTLPDDIIIRVCDFLKLHELAFFSQTSTIYNKWCGNARLWNLLCNKASIKCDYSFRENFVSLVKELNYKSLFVRAEFLTNKFNFTPHRKILGLNDLNTILDNESIPLEIRIHATLHKAILRCNYPLSNDTEKDASAVKNLMEIITHPKAAVQDKRQAGFYFFSIRLQQRTPEVDALAAAKIFSSIPKSEMDFTSWANFRITDGNSLELDPGGTHDERFIETLEKISNDPLHIRRNEALYYQAYMGILKRNNNLNDLQSVSILEYLSNKKLPYLIQFDLIFKRFEMAFKRGVSLVEDKEISNQLFGISQDVKDSYYGKKANLYQAYLQCEKRSSSLTDDEAFKILQESIQNDSLTEKDRVEAMFYCADLRYQNRTSLINDEEAAQLFLKVHRSPLLDRYFRWQACFQLAHMYMEKRIKEAINEEYAVKLFVKIISTYHPLEILKVKSYKYITEYFPHCQLPSRSFNRKLLEAALKNEQFYYAKQSCLKLRGANYFFNDDEAVKILLDTFNNSNAPENYRKASAFLCAYMRIFNRTCLLDDKQAIEYLKIMSEDKTLSLALLSSQAKFWLACLASNQEDLVLEPSKEAFELLNNNYNANAALALKLEDSKRKNWFFKATNIVNDTYNRKFIMQMISCPFVNNDIKNAGQKLIGLSMGGKLVTATEFESFQKGELILIRGELILTSEVIAQMNDCPFFNDSMKVEQDLFRLENNHSYIMADVDSLEEDDSGNFIEMSTSSFSEDSDISFGEDSDSSLAGEEQDEEERT